MNRRTLGRALAVAAAVLTLAAGCGGGVEPASKGAGQGASGALQTLIDAAKKEGELTWYSVPAENIAKSVSDDFAKKYGIKVKYIRLTSADLTSRFSAEAESGTPAAAPLLL